MTAQMSTSYWENISIIFEKATVEESDERVSSRTIWWIL